MNKQENQARAEVKGKKKSFLVQARDTIKSYRLKQRAFFTATTTNYPLIFLNLVLETMPESWHW